MSNTPESGFQTQDPLYSQMLDRLKGYSPKFPRQEFLLLRILSPRNFSIYLCLKYVLTDWDSRHPTFGTFFYRPYLIAELFQYSFATIDRAFKELIKLGLVRCINESEKLFSLEGFELINGVFRKRDVLIKPFEYFRLFLGATLEKNTTYLNENNVNLDVIFSDLHIEPIETIDLPMSNRAKSRFNLVSSNGNLVYKDEPDGDYISDEDLDKFSREIDEEMGKNDV